MTRTIPIVLGSILILGLAIFTGIQRGELNDSKVKLKEKSKDIAFLEETLVTEEKDNLLLTEKNQELHQLVVVLRDSIQDLESQLVGLKKNLRSQRRRVKKLTKQLKKYEKDYQQLKTKIKNLAHQDQNAQAKIESLEAEKKQIKASLEQLQILKEEQAKEEKRIAAEILDREASERKFKLIQSIVNNTTIRFSKIRAKKKQFTNKHLTKIRRKGKKWKYTLIDFYLENPSFDELLDQNFVVKIVDSDTKEVLSFVESNPNFPNSDQDSKGVQFKFDGNMIEIAYFNNQEKNGKNYEIRIYYISEAGEEYLLDGGVRPFIKDKKTLSL